MSGPDPQDSALCLLASATRQVRRLIDLCDEKDDEIIRLRTELDRLMAELNAVGKPTGGSNHGC